MGCSITNDGENKRIQEKFQKSKKVFCCYRWFLKSKSLSERTKLKIHKVMIGPIVMYAAETMTLKRN